MEDYTLEWELQHSYFLRDCLYEEISYELKESNVVIYKKLDNGISEEITLDELIFYIHSDVSVKILSEINNKNVAYGDGWKSRFRACGEFRDLFKSIDAIKKAVENMKIILKYDVDSETEDEESKDDVSEAGGSFADNETLAF